MQYKKKFSDRASACAQWKDKEWKPQKKSVLGEQAAGGEKRQEKGVDEDGSGLGRAGL